MSLLSTVASLWLFFKKSFLFLSNLLSSICFIRNNLLLKQWGAMSQRWTPIDHTLELMPCVAPFSLPVAWPMTCSNQSSVCCWGSDLGPVPWIRLRRIGSFSSSGNVCFGEPWADIKANSLPCRREHLGNPHEEALGWYREGARSSCLSVLVEPPEDSSPSCHLASTAWKTSKDTSRRTTQLSPATHRKVGQ